MHFRSTVILPNNCAPVFLVQNLTGNHHFFQVVEGQAAVHRCKGAVEIKVEDYPVYPAVVNDEKLHRHVEDVGRGLLGPGKVRPGEKIMAGEDFAFYQQLVPGVMFGIGIRNEEAGSVHSAHNPYFFVDEDVIPVGAALHAAIAELYFTDGPLFRQRRLVVSRSCGWSRVQ
jgi:IAA-amino acid hydrolase